MLFSVFGASPNKFLIAAFVTSHDYRRGFKIKGYLPRFVEPGSPWQNGYCESFLSQLCDELIDGTIFRSLLEAKVLAEDYREIYNTERLHGALDYQTPDQFYKAWIHDQEHGECLTKTGS